MSDGRTYTKGRNAEAALDETLRRMAHAPVPDGLEERVKARLASAPREGRLLAWPAPAWAVPVKSDWLRTAAAAAIVAVVAGGGWGVYSHVVQPLAKTDIAAPIRALWTGPAMSGGGFSNAGAMRVPLTLDGPSVSHAGKNAGKRHPGKPAKKTPALARQGGEAASTDKPDQDRLDQDKPGQDKFDQDKLGQDKFDHAATPTAAK